MLYASNSPRNRRVLKSAFFRWRVTPGNAETPCGVISATPGAPAILISVLMLIPGPPIVAAAPVEERHSGGRRFLWLEKDTIATIRVLATYLKKNL